MTLRKDVIHEVVNGCHVFVSLRTAWDECPFIIHVSPRTGFIWDCIEKGYTKESCIKGLKDQFAMENDAADKLYQSFIRSAVRFHYMNVEEEE